MTADFWRWEADPLFAAAEDVQDSCDRLESAYRTWLHAASVAKSTPDDPDAVHTHEFCRGKLLTALGISKWQLEEFERAISQPPYSDDVARRIHFVQAIGNKISEFEKAILDAVPEISSKGLVNLADDDRDNLTKFLCGTKPPESPAAASDELNTVDKGKSKDGSPAFPLATRESEGCAQLTSPLLVSAMARIITEIKSTSSGSLVEGISFKTKNVDCHFLDLPGKLEDAIVGVHFERDNDTFIQCPTDRVLGETFIAHDGRCRDVVEMNGQHRSVTVSSGSNRWKVEALPWKPEERSMESERNCTAKSQSSLWALFSKKKRPTHRVHKNCFKRWKDGDADSEDLAMLSGYSNFEHDLELGSIDSWLDKRFSNCCTSEEQSSQWVLQHAQHLRPSRPLALAIVMTVGFIGLLSFHVKAFF